MQEAIRKRQEQSLWKSMLLFVLTLTGKQRSVGWSVSALMLRSKLQNIYAAEEECMLWPDRTIEANVVRVAVARCQRGHCCHHSSFWKIITVDRLTVFQPAHDGESRCSIVDFLLRSPCTQGSFGRCWLVSKSNWSLRMPLWIDWVLFFTGCESNHAHARYVSW